MQRNFELNEIINYACMKYVLHFTLHTTKSNGILSKKWSGMVKLKMVKMRKEVIFEAGTLPNI